MKIPNHVKYLGEIFLKNGYELYIVGGYVRNNLLDLESKDIDICSSMPPYKFAEIKEKDVYIEKKAYGLGTFSVVHKYMGEVYNYEYTSFRKDNYSRGFAHTPDSISFTNDIKEDAERRDFTVNALYANMQGEILDPTQKGLEDINKKILRQVAKDTLNSDALRILRLARFYGQYGFKIESETLKSAIKNSEGLKDLSIERVQEEFFNILICDKKYNNNNLLKTLYLLNSFGFYKYFLQEIENAKGVVQSKIYHKYDVFNHSLHTCSAVPPNIILRVSALLHDIGKKKCVEENGNMHLHNIIGKELAKDALKNLKVNSDIIEDVCQLVYYHMFDLDNKAKKSSVLKVLIELQEEQFKKLIVLREGDFLGSGRNAAANSAKKWHNILVDAKNKNAPIKISQLAVNGKDIIKELNISEGKEVGEILKKLHLIALKKSTQNVYKNLIKYAKIMYSKKNESEE